MKEAIYIENFGGLKKMSFELKSINVLIGPQASGKSISAKLIYFFKNFSSEIIKSVENGESKRELDSKQKEKFTTYFPKESWPKNSFKIEYKINDSSITIERKASKTLSFSYSDDYKKILNKGRKYLKEEQKKLEQEIRIPSYKINRNTRNRFYECLKTDISEVSSYTQFFVPAGRSFFANIQSSIFSFLSNNKSLDPFLIEFGSFYDNFKRFANDEDFGRNKKPDKNFDKLINEIMNGNFLREKDKDYIIHNDSRKVNLSNASSGQQETLPLVLILKALTKLHFSNGGATLYIEEPEAHLFPTAQKKIIQLLARTFNNSRNNFQIIVTTHSPYILSSFNNLLEAGKIIEEQPNKINDVYKVIPKEEVLNPNDIIAYSVFGGQKKVLIDEETQLISQNILDSVSDEIAIDFGKLLDIEF
ncbi:ATP-binding protein [uncultured Polaribacter sp.]|uniref:AAA family ATPase n=1 Tax=uncultured Polaribacter sp. TaxID=174711 RepID=UPI00262B9F86|nr:ATP-binding protein [uncultured Polaribacter sp.]